MLEMLACLVLLVAAASWDSISGECEFPPSHPVHSNGLYTSPGQQPLVQLLDQFRVYVYSDTFGDCSGCVRALTYCYRPGSVASETLFTVEIRKNNAMVQTSYEVSVNPNNDLNDRSNCISDLLSSPYCCIHETLAEPFSVNYSLHYALRVPSEPSSHLLRHLNQLASGTQYRIGANEEINTPVYKPLFFFTIDSTNNNCNSATDGPTESTTASMSEPSTTNSSSTDAGSVTTGTGTTGSTTASDESTASTGNTDTADSTRTALGVVGAVLAVVILLSVAVVVVVLCLKTRRKSVVVTHIGEAEGFTNEQETNQTVLYIHLSENKAYSLHPSPAYDYENDEDNMRRAKGIRVHQKKPPQQYSMKHNAAYGAFSRPNTSTTTATAATIAE